jgi:lipoprotein NlpI/rhodanese-related sulfurtransferase
LGLKLAVRRGSIEGAPFLLIDALDHKGPAYYNIPNSIEIPYAGRPGDFHDDIQRKLEDELKKRTANNPDMALIFYCAGSQCWESYNACLRAINLGYTRVYWYRGGISAWFNIRTYDVKDLDLTRIEVKSSTVLANTPEIIGIMGRVIGRVFKSEILNDDSQTIPLDALIADASNNRGFQHLRNGDYDYAIRDYHQAIKLNPENPQFYFNRGLAYQGKREYDRAIEDFDKATKLNQNYVMAHFYRGQAYFEKRDYDHAVENYDQAIELNPEFVDAYTNRAFAHYSKGDYDRAIEDYDEAIKLDPKSAESYTARGLAHFAKADHDRAVQDLTQSIQLKSRNRIAYQYRGLAELYSNRAGLAVDDLTTAVKLAPTSHYPVIWLHIARMRAGQGDLQEVAENAQKLDKAKWPWHVVSLFLGSSSSEAVRAAAKEADNSDTQREQACEADFYLGIYHQERGANDEARRLFESVKEACAGAFLEYSAANHELQRLR